MLAASTEFEPAIQAQGRALGFAPAVVYVPHPIQDRTDAELRTLADNAIERLLASLTTPGCIPAEGAA